METQALISLLHESLYLILVFCFFLFFAMVRSKQSLINLILGLYFALLISLTFPYYDQLFNAIGDEGVADAVPMLVLFAFFTLISTFVFNRLMPREYGEGAFEGIGKKALFALLGSILVMVYSYHVLPITELFTPGSPIQMLFGPEDRFFWWLLVPLLGLLFL